VTVAHAYLGLGSNLGDRLSYLQLAVDELARARAITVTGVSRVYATDPVGGPEQGEYLNAVVAVETTLAPHALLDVAHDIEAAAERVRTVRFGPRTLDVDVLLYDDMHIDDDTLTIPHPRLAERAFVLLPLHDVAPQLVPLLPQEREGVRDAEVALRLPAG
jgi:2-amino-4-hydroxy-6-hydroxymethyldihydropteridine diphosphokinase